jgi:hypothetical protein
MDNLLQTTRGTIYQVVMDNLLQTIGEPIHLAASIPLATPILEILILRFKKALHR